MSDAITRYSVPVNARFNVRAMRADACYPAPMQSEWLPRLLAAIEADERSYAQLSADAEHPRGDFSDFSVQ